MKKALLIIVTVLLMLGIHFLGYIQNGYHGIGAEIMVPFLVWCGYLAYKDTRQREERHRKLQEELQRQIKEYKDL